MTVRVPTRLVTRDPEQLAPEVGLVCVSDSEPGITRHRRGRGFAYRDASGSFVRPPDRDRLAGLVVPPAWTDVWMCPTEQGHLQATGRDLAHRKQYRYHDDFRALCEQRKFERLRYFPRALRRLRAQVEKDLQRQPGDRRHAVAAALRLIDEGLVRVGNEVSAQNGHHGATTLHVDHVDTEPDEGYVLLQYRGKSGAPRTVVIEDDRLGSALTDLAEGGHDELFWFCDEDGERRSIDATDVNTTIVETVGPAFSAKDFRTWGGSRAALEARVAGGDAVDAADAASEALGNTRHVARSSYIHPAVLDANREEVEAVWSRSRSSHWFRRGDSALAKLLAP